MKLKYKKTSGSLGHLNYIENNEFVSTLKIYPMAHFDFYWYNLLCYRVYSKLSSDALFRKRDVFTPYRIINTTFRFSIFF